MNAVARSFGARALSFVPTALATLLASRLIIEHFGVAAFNAYTLIFSLINLVPLNNLGVGAAVTSAYAEDGIDSSRAERTVLTASRVLAISAAGTAIVSMVLGVFGLWRPLLGEASGPDLWVGISLVVYAVTFLPGIGQSMLLGIHRNHTTILIQSFFNPLNAIIVAVIVFTGSTDNIVVLVPCVSLLAVNVWTSVIASRATHISWRSIARKLTSPKRFPGAKIRSMSGPVLIITLSTPIALQSDRIVLSHVSTEQAVAQYSVALQIFGPALVLIAATAQPLWPIWAQARAAGRRGPGVLRIVGLFSVGGIAVGAVLALLSGPVARLVAGSEVQIGGLLAVAGALGVLTAAMSHPVAMSLMYPAGVKIVVWCTLLALPLNIGLSIVMGRHLGAAGPLFASCIIGIGVQALPGLIISARRQRTGRDLGSSLEPEVDVVVPGEPVDLPVEVPVRRARPSREAFAAVTPYRAFRSNEEPARHVLPTSAQAPIPPTTPTPDAPRRRPRPGPRTIAVTEPRHASRISADAAAAVAGALSGATGMSTSADAYPDVDEPVPAGAGPKLQPIAPFRRPRDSHRPH